MIDMYLTLLRGPDISLGTWKPQKPIRITGVDAFLNTEATNGRRAIRLRFGERIYIHFHSLQQGITIARRDHLILNSRKVRNASKTSSKFQSRQLHTSQHLKLCIIYISSSTSLLIFVICNTAAAVQLGDPDSRYVALKSGCVLYYPRVQTQLNSWQHLPDDT